MKYLLALLFMVIAMNGFCQNKTNSDTSFRLADIHFKKTVFLDAASKKVIDSVLMVMRSYPRLKLYVQGYTGQCELCQQVSWDRVYSVVQYAKQQKFDSAQIIFAYGFDAGDLRTINLSATSEDGPSIVPAPIPCYSYHKLTPKRCTGLDGHAKPKL